EANAEADAKRKEEAELRNEADQLVFQVDKTITDLGEQITEEEKKSVEDAKEELKKALEAGELEGIKTSKEKLEGVLQPLVMKVYEQAAAAAQAAQGEAGA
ncbi:molecular chaperone DnaK, partial [Butyricicoccus sp. 1XD8-22]